MVKKELFDILLEEDFVDRYQEDQEKAVDVIIPLLNTNYLFEKSLINFYRSIPINRLLIGDGGSTDGSIEIVKKFPRVEVFDYSEHKSQGYSIRKLIEACETEFFIYLHADVFLPEDWFDTMYEHRNDHLWYECGRRYFSIVEWLLPTEKAKRAYSGSQFGSTKEMQSAISVVEDDYLQRNEDIIIAELIGYENYYKYADTYHYHQFLPRRGKEQPPLEKSPLKIIHGDVEWQKKIYKMQWRGIVKYCEPKPYLVKATKAAIKVLHELDSFDTQKAQKWVLETNEDWYPFLWPSVLDRIKQILQLK